VRAGLVLVVCAAGYSQILGLGDVTRGDAGQAPPNTVIGRFYTHCMTEAASMDVPIDVSQEQIRALIPDASEPSGFRVSTGEGHTDGTFRIDDVPDGIEYYFAQGRVAWVTDQHVLDIHNNRPGRCNPEPAHATASSTLSVSLTNVQPWHANKDGVDTLYVYSNSLLLYGRLAQPLADATEVTGTLDWLDATSYVAGVRDLPDAAAADDVRAAHLRVELSSGASGRHQRVTTTADVMSRDDITLANGGTATLTGAMTPVPRTSSVTIGMQRGQLDAGFDPTTVFTSVTTALYAHPAPDDYGYLFNVPLAAIDWIDWTRGSTLSESIDVAYGDPFPATWTRLVETDYFRRRYYRLPGTTMVRYLTGESQDIRVYEEGAISTVPMLTPVGNMRITDTGGAEHDASLGGLVKFDGIHPITVTWNPVLGATQYLVDIRRVVANGTDSTTVFTGDVYTMKSSAVVPAEMFAGGEFFVIDVRAYTTASDYAHGEISPNGPPLRKTVTPSGLLRFSSKCGDGAKDSTEECDGGGETAACDVDCSMPVCGDGLRNAAAGEACDTAADTPSCDSDCTAAQCGDGHVNRAVEDCDDGDAIDSGNGCSATCRFNNVCGDGIVQSVEEQCDGGGVETATCDSDCTARVCGDGHVNTAGGEECDYGGFNGQGHCSSTCKLQ
jgi:cysteine-rich repeat protein